MLHTLVLEVHCTKPCQLGKVSLQVMAQHSTLLVTRPIVPPEDIQNNQRQQLLMKCQPLIQAQHTITVTDTPST